MPREQEPSREELIAAIGSECSCGCAQCDNGAHCKRSRNACHVGFRKPGSLRAILHSRLA